MKQRSFFDVEYDLPYPKDKRNSWTLYIDGASRNNPGPAGAGICLCKDGKAVAEKSFFLGTKTNNQAEYLALLLGLFYAKKYIQPMDHLEIISDSQLLVRQLQGVYRVKHHDLKPLYAMARTLLSFKQYSVTHVMREENKRADFLANAGIDKKIPVPDEFITLLLRHEIPWYE